MSPQRPQIRIPREALEEFEAVEKEDWEEGITISALVGWINMVENRFRPDDLDSRSGKEFSERSLRHYQTLGCIDAPRRVGKQARYGFRQYLQALLIRKLIWERVSSDQIGVLMREKSNEEYKTMLFDGVEIIAQRSAPGTPPFPVGSSETWKRHTVGTGIELHLSEGRGNISPQERKLIISEIERILSSK